MRGSRSKKEERKLKIPEMSHMRATLEVKPTPIHTETPKQVARRTTQMPCDRYEHQKGSRRFRRAWSTTAGGRKGGGRETGMGGGTNLQAWSKELHRALPARLAR